MKDPIISIQKGLDDYKEALEAEGFEVHYSGYDDSKANGDSCMLVLDVSNMSVEEVIKIVKTKECNC
jgi:hypothetical protein